MVSMQNRLAKYGYLFMLMTVVAVISAAGYGFVQMQKQIVIDEARLNLATIADLKAAQILSWRRERLMEAKSLHFNSMMSHRIRDHLKNPEETEVIKELDSWMEQLRDAGGYSKVMLFTPDAGLITPVSSDAGPLKSHYHNLVRQAAQKQEPILTDLHYDPVTDVIDINLVVPLMHRENGLNTCIAVLLIDIDPYRYLYPLIRTWTTPSFSGESILVRRDGDDVLYLSNLRFKPDSALRFRLPLSTPELPTARAALGQEGIFDGTDYRGVQVYAAIRTIPDSPWAIVTKIDRQEILEPVTNRIWYVIGTCILVVLATGLGFSLWWRRKQEAYLLLQYDSELKFNRELKQAELALQNANNLLENRVATRTEELTNSNTKLRQEIAERKQVEELLRKHFQAIQQSPVAIVITDLDGTIEFVNPKFTEYCGYTYDEVIGQNPRILKSELTAAEVHKQMWETITAGQVWEGDLCNRKKNGELYWEHAKLLPVKNQAGVTTNFMAFKEDITKQRQLEDKLVMARKLETIGQIAGGVAHEVRNPLNAILSITEALFREKEFDNNTEYAPYVEHIRTQVKRLANLMNDLLDLGKPISAANLNAVPLLEICTQTMELWKVSSMSENRQVVLSAAKGAAAIRVMADTGRLQQVIFNLLENAGNHCPAGCTITLHLPEPVPDSGLAQVLIVDSGRGIPEEKLSRIFEPFYSDRRGGTGLGLSLVKHFIENMGGSVRIWNNEPPPGCTAELQIPLALEEHA
jgi:PAS domain S-box-containing protein